VSAVDAGGRCRSGEHARRLCLLTAITGAWLGAMTAGARPNIVFILADDLGYGDLGCYGHPRIETPHLDQLAAAGTRFTQFYASHSVCSPSRAAALTGQHPSRWNIYAHFAWLEENARRGMPDWLDAGAPSMARTLQEAGYRTGLFGKWHLGGGSARTFAGRAINSAEAPPVAAYGFDEARTIFGNSPTWRGTELVGEPHETYPYADQAWLTDSSRLIADASIDFIERHSREHAGRPFLLHVWLHDPHVPLLPSDAMRRPYADIADRGRQAYYSAVTEMDRQIGRILARLDVLGLGDTTIVLFTSDNGTPARIASVDSGRSLGLETDTAGSNGPLRGWKWHLHEGGIRVPFIVRWPGRTPSGRTDSTSVLNLYDLPLALMRLGGASLPAGYASDGVDVTDALLGRPFIRGRPMFWHNPTSNRRGPALAIRDGKWKLLIEADDTAAELYDLERDPSESVNLADDHPEIVLGLRHRLYDWYRSLPPPANRPPRPARPE